MNENTSFFGGEGFLIFALLLLFMGNGFGGLGNIGGKQIATTDDLNFGRLEQQVRANENYIQQGFTNIGNGICNLGYTMAEKINGVNTSVLESRYLTDKTIVDSNAQVLAAINGISQKMDADKAAALQNRVNQLELAQAMCGVVRYPTTMAYNAGTSPFCNCGGCSCNY